jgi:hypothetical protein
MERVFFRRISSSPSSALQKWTGFMKNSNLWGYGIPCAFPFSLQEESFMTERNGVSLCCLLAGYGCHVV